MTLMSEITRVSNNIAAAYIALDGKGATLPETQNSANLADTISSISTGGGSGDNWSAIKNEIDSYTDGFSYIDKGFQYYNSNSGLASSYLVTYVEFDENAPNIYYITKTFMQGLKVPETATLDTETYSGKIKVSFNGDKYFYIATNNLNMFEAIYLESVGLGLADVAGFTKQIASKYIHESQYTRDNKKDMGSYPGGPLFNAYYNFPYLKHIYFSNFTYTFNSNPSDKDGLPAFLFSDKIDNAEKCAVFSNVTEGVTSFSQSFSNSMFTYNSYFAVIKSCPIVFDCSTATSNMTLDIHSGGISSKPTYYGVNIKDLYLIPPTTWNINWLSYLGNSSYDVANMPLKCLKFFSDNAPNVSGKTLTIGQQMIRAANAEDSTIITALQSKGWTVQ